MWCCSLMPYFRLPYNLLVWLSNYTILSCPFNRLVHKDFSALSVSIALRCKVMSKNSRAQKNILNIPQYRKAVYSALWVQLALSICFSPHSSVVIVITACTTHSTTNIVIEEIMSGLVLFNPFLNQFHYCWI